MATTQEITVDQKPIDLAPIDPNVIIPDHVKRAAAAAEAYYAKPAEPVAEAPTPVAEVTPEPPAEEPPVQQVQAPPLAPEHSDYLTPSKQEIHESDWAARYNSMKGRYEASQRTIGSMQEQMSQLGDELMRTQQLLRGQPEAQTTQRSNNKLITPEDEQAYGPELIDLARRAAAEQLGPEITQLREENNKLKGRVTATAQGEVKQSLSRDVPNWQEINRSTEFKNWLRLPNVYTGQVRQQMLNEAYSAANAPKVVAFFKDFLREGVATGQVAPAPQYEQPSPAPRVAAVALETLAAPGRARPASGEFSAPADKPVITHAQIKEYYANVRRGVYAGRETEKSRLENMIFDAQREGRVR